MEERETLDIKIRNYRNWGKKYMLYSIIAEDWMIVYSKNSNAEMLMPNMLILSREVMRRHVS